MAVFVNCCFSIVKVAKEDKPPICYVQFYNQNTTYKKNTLYSESPHQSTQISILFK